MGASLAEQCLSPRLNVQRQIIENKKQEEAFVSPVVHSHSVPFLFSFLVFRLVVGFSYLTHQKCVTLSGGSEEAQFQFI